MCSGTMARSSAPAPPVAVGQGIAEFEQGRDINVSGQVLEAICRALLLDASERAHVNSS
jgi:hypothetical protein